MLGDNIKKYRNLKGITQKDLADKLFVTPQAVSRWENGEVEPSITTIMDMAKIFDVSVDVILGNKKEEITEEQSASVTEIEEPNIKYVYAEPAQPVLAVCETCNKPIYNGNEIVRRNIRSGKTNGSHVFCKECENKRLAELKKLQIEDAARFRGKSFWLGGIVAVVFIAFAIFAITRSEMTTFAAFLVLAILGFCYVSCLCLKNNFIGDMTLEIFSWGFVKMPGLIFSLDLDGIIWLITVKLFLWILGLLLMVVFGLLAIILGFTLSIFVYPYAIVKNIKHPELNDVIYNV